MSRTFQENVRATLNEAAHRQDSTFKLKYFKLHGLAYTSRMILATSGAKWECVFPDDWANVEKQDTHFGFLPILYETTASHQTIEVPESEAIENYLSKKFKLLGADDYDEVQIRAFASSIQALLTYYIMRVAVVKDAAHKAVMMERFLTEALPPFVANHERHLKASGSNGHYVGNKVCRMGCSLFFFDLCLSCHLLPPAPPVTFEQKLLTMTLSIRQRNGRTAVHRGRQADDCHLHDQKCHW
ncbi:unnamed protein product [Mortierella alpina]